MYVGFGPEGDRIDWGTPLARLAGKWRQVREEYYRRHAVHRALLELHVQGEKRGFADLLLGITNPRASYSASQHEVGRRILSANQKAENLVYEFGRQLMQVQSALKVPEMVRAARLRHLTLAVGSEASCLLNPQVCWTTNMRTIWARLLYNHAGSYTSADKELNLYGHKGDPSETTYEMWITIHKDIGRMIENLFERSVYEAGRELVEPGEIKNLWADAICNRIYEVSRSSDSDSRLA
jgi:hypothetical protein